MDVRFRAAGLVVVVAALATAWWITRPTPRAATPAPAIPSTSQAGIDRETPAVELQASADAGTRDARSELAAPAGEAEPARAPGPQVHPGRVRDLDGAPVGEIAVYRASDTGEFVRQELFANTDASGAFTWTEAVWSPLVAESEDLTTVLPAFAGRGACVIVVAPARSYSGIVVDEAGMRLPGAQLSVQTDASVARKLLPGEERAGSREWRATSSPDGAFALERIGWTPDLAVVARLDGFLEARTPLPMQSTDALEILLHRPAEDARSLAGTVVDPSGTAVEGAAVAFEQGAQATSDREGRFVVAAPESRGRADLWAVKAGRLPARREFADLAAFLAASPREPVVLALGDAPPSIAGRVIEGDGRPIEGAQVFTWDLARWTHGEFVETRLTSEWFPGRATTDADGRFRITGLLSRAYTLRAIHPRTLQVTSREAVEAGTQDVVLACAGSEGARRVAGHVVDPRGEPISGVRLFCGRDSAPGIAWLGSPLVTADVPASDVQGAFEFAALCVEGTYLLPAGPGIADQERFELSPSMELEHLSITVSRICRFQIVLESDAQEADSFGVLDASDHGLPLGYDLGNMSVVGNGLFDLAGGRSEIMKCDERARTIVLRKKGAEVRRVPVRLAPGEVQVLKL